MTSDMMLLLENARSLFRSNIAHFPTTGKIKVLAASSGGVDSFMAAAVVKLLSRTTNLELDTCIYACHHIRSKDEIRLDKKNASLQALNLGADFEAHCMPMCGSNHNETIARAGRYELLKSVAKARSCAVIVTGHHADDQAETVLARVFKGASADSMKCIRPVVSMGNIILFRPLLSSSKKDIIDAHKKEYGRIKYSMDSTNEDNSIERNWIRNVMLPAIKQRYGDNASVRIGRIANVLQKESDGV